MISSSENGTQISNAVLTTTITNTQAPGLLRSSIDERIVKIRPMATPIDQLSRCAGARPARSLKVEYYAIDTKDVKSKVKRMITPSPEIINDDPATFYLPVNNPAVFSKSETILIPRIEMTVGDSTSPLALYVVDVDTEKGLLVAPVNATYADGAFNFPTIAAGLEVIRMGRAAAELDVQTPQYEALPKKSENFCQIFKMQIEESTYQKLANKEVDWNFSDQEEVAIIDMRLGMEKNFLFGAKARIFDPVKGEEVYLTGGIWNQAQRVYNFSSPVSESSLIALSRQTFTGCGSGTGRKILIGGTKLIEDISNIQRNKVLIGTDTLTRFGMEFREIRTNFGSIYILASEVFDQCGHDNDGIIIDPEFLCKYVHVPFNTQRLDLRSAGTRNSDAIVLTEASCLVLRHPKAHLRVYGYKG